MRWTTGVPRLGEVRFRKGFLTLPKEINGEVRWLEYAEWIEEYVLEEDYDSSLWYWKPIRWDN